MPKADKRANSTAQPGSSTITGSPGRSSVRLTMSSACVAPTVVMMFSGAACTFSVASFLDSTRRSPVSPRGSPYCSEKSFNARVLVTLRTAAGMNVDSSQAGGNTPMPGCGLSLILWNMPRISAVALTGGAPRAAPRPAPRAANQCAVLQLPMARSTSWAPASSSSAPLSSNPLAISRTKKPRFLRASTSPCASNWSYAATTVEGLTPCCCAHCRTEGRRAPGASSRLRMRSPKRADSCSVSDWVVVFISMAVSLCTVIAANTDHELRCLTVLVVY
ncbi:hypothetical protein D3C71_970090 [compost metagenome]